MLLLAVTVTALSTCTRAAGAHGVDPIGIGLVEEGGGAVRVRIDRPASLLGAAIGVVVDAGCVQRGEATRTVTASRAVDELSFHCERALSGRVVHVDGLAATGLDAVFRAQLAGGAVHRTVVAASTPEVSLPISSGRLRSVGAYLGLGAKHLLLGFDHLLFVLGTLLLERTPRRAALALTGFTCGHSLTLGAAALGWLRVPAAAAEVGIALSLVWLAVAIPRSSETSRGYRLPAVTSAIGLVHGLGFAGGLTAAGTPPAELPLALAGFNVGIELTQLGLVVFAFAIVAMAKAGRFSPPAAARDWLAHGIGALAVMWCFERLAAV